MSHEDYKIELFVFPDGTQVEMIVFDPAARVRGGASPAAPARAATHDQDRPGALLRPRPAGRPKTRTRTAAPSAAARSSTRSTGTAAAPPAGR